MRRLALSEEQLRLASPRRDDEQVALFTAILIGATDERDSSPVWRRRRGVVFAGPRRQPAEARRQEPDVRGSLVDHRVVDERSAARSQRDPSDVRRLVPATSFSLRTILPEAVLIAVSPHATRARSVEYRGSSPPHGFRSGRFAPVS